jgi:Ferritin-like domain
MLATLATPSEAAAEVSDVEVLQFGLRFERMQATFYTQAEEMGTIGRMPGATQKWARTLGAHERAHVKIIKSVLGRKAEPSPFFEFGNTIESGAAFTRTAVAMEDLTVALLTGIVPQVHDRALTAALLGLLTVEARHAAWARHIVGTVPAPAAFDEPKTLHQVRGVLARTRFIAQQPKMTAKRKPKYTG